ncbi:4-phosphoerythronate dehydrogenase PdxB [Pseudomonas sp. Marseille-QA0892]
MRIVADENIPYVDTFFGTFGEIVRRPGRAICWEDIRTADVLLVRSVTPVTEALLAGTSVRFVGTCTIGTDHIDTAYCDSAGIAWASAPGCNARGVVDYVLGAVLTLAERTGLDPAGRRYGVIGVGQVGSRVQALLTGLGWDVNVCDPYRANEPGFAHVPVDELIARCDVITVHTPLQRMGEHPTYHLLDEERLADLAAGSWLINASRGETVDTQALVRRLKASGDLRVVLDVWEGEPAADPSLAALCDLATPHIAGYSLDGKMRGTSQIYRAFCEYLGMEPEVDDASILPAHWLSLTLSADAPPAEALKAISRFIYDPRRDDADFRRSLVGAPIERHLAFDRLRRDYPVRRELDGLRVAIQGQTTGYEELTRVLNAIGVLVG